jgi:hypothetical protein
LVRVEAEQQLEDGPGWYRLTIHGLETHAGGLELMIRRPGASQVYLGEHGWQDGEAWLQLPAEPDGDALRVRLGPPHTLRLAKATTLELRVRRPGQPDSRTRLGWPRIVLQAENDSAPAADAPAEPAIAPPAAPVSPLLPAHRAVISTPLTADARAPASRVRNMPVTTWAGFGIVAVLVGAVLLTLLLSWQSDPGSTPTPARVFSEEAVRTFIAADPDGPSAVTEASLYAAAGHPDLALLLYRHAARRGEPKAALAIGRRDDPEGFDPARSPFATPDPDQAARFYEQAAGTGDAEAQLRLGRLLLSGRTSGETDAERGALWLQRAADQGNAEARSALATLGKSP